MDEVSKNFYFNNNLSKPINRNITDTHVVFLDTKLDLHHFKFYISQKQS